MNTIYLINKNNNRLKKNQQFFHHIFLIKNSKHLISFHSRSLCVYVYVLRGRVRVCIPDAAGRAFVNGRLRV